MNTMKMAGISIEANLDNNDKLTEQVLTSLREYCPVNQKNYHISQTDNITTGNENISVRTIAIPILPGIPNNIAYETTICPKKQHKINIMIDLFEQPGYLKKELPSQQLREISDNLQRDNKSKYQRLTLEW